MSIHKGSHLKKYISKTPWYLLSSISTKLIGFLLLPLYARYFTPEDIGTLAIYESMGRILVIAISLYLDAAFIRFYYLIKASHQEDMPSYFSTHFWFLSIWGGLISLVLCFTLDGVVPGLPPAGLLVIPSLVFSQLFGQLTIILTSVWTADLLVKRIAIFNISFSVLALLFTIFLIVEQEFNWEARIYSLLVVNIIQLLIIIGFAISKGWLRFQFHKKWIVQSLRYSIPLVPSLAAGWIAMFSDRLILSHYGRLDQVGIYSIAAQFALILYVVNDSVTKIQGPLSMAGLTDDTVVAKTKIANFIYVYLSFVIFIFVACAAIIPQIITTFLGDEYSQASNIFMLLGWVYVSSGLYRVFTNIISFHGRTWIITVGAFIQALTNIALNLMLIPHYGMYAAALSTVVSILLYTFWIAVNSQALDKVYLNYKRISLLVITGICAITCLYAVDESQLNLSISLACKALVLVSVLLLFIYLQNAKTKKLLRRFVNSM